MEATFAQTPVQKRYWERRRSWLLWCERYELWRKRCKWRLYQVFFFVSSLKLI